jgi:putative transposase
VHILFECKPSLDITKYINVLKGNSSRKLRKEFEQQLSPLLFGDALWSPSYYLATAGNVSLHSLMDYVNNQNY